MFEVSMIKPALRQDRFYLPYSFCRQSRHSRTSASPCGNRQTLSTYAPGGTATRRGGGFRALPSPASGFR